MKSYQKLLTVLLIGTAEMLAAGAAQAGYFDAYGYYHQTCVPGYTAYGPYGAFWVPPVCG